MIKRYLLEEIKVHLDQREISLIVGPRQAGKTTIMLALQEYLRKKGRKSVWLNLDVEADKRFFESQESLIRKIQLEVGDDGGVVFIDEIQRKENAGLFLKGIYDQNLPLKFIVSGSGSLELKEKIHESLAGRKRLFELTTLSLAEFVNFRTDYMYEDKLADYFSVEKEKTRGLLEEYLNFGGYPRVVLSETSDEKRLVIDEIYRSYVEKDVSYLLGVKKTEAYGNLVKILASQVGGLINFSELSSILGISAQTVKDYLWCLEKTYIVQKVPPFFRNTRKEIAKAPVVYFCDLGLRNYSLGTFGYSIEPQYTGWLFQNFIFNILKEKTRHSPAKIRYWRTKDGAEVDFIVDKARELIPVEVKYRALKQPAIPRPLRSFIGKYEPEKAFVANLSLEATTTLKNTIIEFIPFYRGGDVVS